MKIGIDIGNVIIGGGGEDTSFFSDNYVNTPEVEGARDSLVALKQGGHELHVISKCGPSVELKSVVWLENYNYFPWIFLERRLNFVRKRELKAPMAQALELDIFIDDRQDIIDSMEGIVEYPILFTSWEQTNAILKGIFPS